MDAAFAGQTCIKTRTMRASVRMWAADGGDVLSYYQQGITQLSRQRCSLAACLQTLDHLVLLFTSGLVLHSIPPAPRLLFVSPSVG